MDEKENLEFNKKILEFNILDSRIRELEQNLALLEKQISELQICQISLDEVKNSKKESEVLASLSPGIFVKTNLANNSEVIIDIGSKILCKKKIDEAKKIIENKLNKALEIHDRLISEITIIAQNLGNLEKEIRKSQNKVL